MKLRPQFPTLALLLFAAFSSFGCDTSEGGNQGTGGVSSGGGTSGGSDIGGFLLSSISVPENFTWKINRPISFIFTQPVDFSSISLNSIAIRDSDNFPPSGVFSFDPAQPRVVVFQPTCPVQSDFSDAGFLPGGKQYTIVVIGKDGGSGTSVKSAAGEELEISQTRVFFTPASSELSTLFEDLVSGAPQPVVRPLGSTSLGATFIEVAEDSTVANRIYFERNIGTQVISKPGSGDGSIPTGHPLEALENGMPLNLYSDRTSRLVFMLEVNQPVNPAPENINSNRIRLEAEQTLGAGDFASIPATVTLVRNCTTTGATVRIVPIGVLPQNVDLRVVVEATFEDLIGDNHSAPIDNFGIIRTRNVGATLADELLEEFDLNASMAGSLEDDQAPFSVPRAIWGKNGKLEPRFDFDGTGGPTGAFDFVVRGTGGTVVIDTSSQTVLDANQTLSQTIINGRMDVRNFTVEPGGRLELRGTNPMIINATGDVRIDGVIDLVGFSSADVSGVFTAASPEGGAAGNLGGGKGGDASVNTSSSTPRGNHGNGAFVLENAGGRGGESGFGADPTANTAKKIQDSHPKYRRGGAGGGGVFGANVVYPVTAGGPIPSNLSGTRARLGGNGDATSTGALSGLPSPAGGDVGPSPFVDADSSNDFFGVLYDSMTQMLTLGELTGLHAGAGGGGGGDCVRSFSYPNPVFTNKTEDKGAGGAGGSGGLLIRALGDVDFGPLGKIVADGGDGARGQTIQFSGNFFVKAGPGGGGGSGGHVIIESAGMIDLGTGVDVISARGGAGGPGVKPAKLLSGARGGNGGPGVVQLHTPGGLSDVMSTQALELAVVPPPKILLPNFGSTSRARSGWIPLGGAVGNLPEDVTFLFGGTDSTSGKINDLNTDSNVDDLTEIIGPRALTTSGAPVLVDGHTLVFDFVNDAATLFGGGDAIYRDNPVLIKNFVLVLREVADPTMVFRRYNIASAVIDPTDADKMILNTSSTELAFSEFVGSASSPFPAVGDVEFLILPRFFRVVTNGVDSSLPPSTSITIHFEGTGRDAFGNPESTILVPMTADIDDLSDSMLAKPVHFFRFEVEFNIDAMAAGLTATSPRPVLDFLRMPFKF